MAIAPNRVEMVLFRIGDGFCVWEEDLNHHGDVRKIYKQIKFSCLKARWSMS